MSEFQIANPIETISFNISFAEIKKHILNVVTSFSTEYTVVSNETDKIVLFNIPANKEDNAIGKDQIIHIDNEYAAGRKTTIKMTITNEDNKISSYTELNRDTKSLNVFAILLKKSIEGTLSETIANIKDEKRPGVFSLKVVLRILFIVAAIVIIYFIFSRIMH